ncbi:MAG: PPC domain-containing protein [Thermoplasmatota archaeon]
MTEGEKKNRTGLIVGLMIAAFVGLMLVTGGIIATVLLLLGGDEDRSPQEDVVYTYINCFETGDFSDMEDILMDEDGNFLAEEDPESLDEYIGWMGEERVEIFEFRIDRVEKTDMRAENTGNIYFVHFTATTNEDGPHDTQSWYFAVAQNKDSGRWGMALDEFKYIMDPDGFEPNDDRSEATQISTGKTEGFNIHEGDEDWFKFTITSSGDYRITVAGDKGGDTTIELYSGDNDHIDGNDDRDEDLFSEIEVYLEEGDYYLMVEAYSDAVPSYYVEVEAL